MGENVKKQPELSLQDHALGFVRFANEYFNAAHAVYARSAERSDISIRSPMYQMAGICMELSGKAMLAQAGKNEFDAAGHDLNQLHEECRNQFPDFDLLGRRVNTDEFRAFCDAYKQNVFRYGAVVRKTRTPFTSIGFHSEICITVMNDWFGKACFQTNHEADI